MWFRNIFNVKPNPKRGSSGQGLPGATGLTPQALRQLNRLCLNTDLLRLDQPVGSRASAMRRPASDFREHRAYVPGDDVRYVDWKASARQEHIFIKQGEQQKAASVILLVDCSASMAWGQVPKSHAALSLAQALGYMTLSHGDRLLILPVTNGDTSGPRPLGPLWGKGQVSMLPGYLQGLRFQGQIDLVQALVSLGRGKLSRGGLVLVLSDLLGVNDLTPALDVLKAPGWKAAFLHLLHPEELNPGLRGHFEMHDIETGGKKISTVTPGILETYRKRLTAWQNELLQRCQERSAIYTLLPTHWSLENDVLPALRRIRVVRAL